MKMEDFGSAVGDIGGAMKAKVRGKIMEVLLFFANFKQWRKERLDLFRQQAYQDVRDVAERWDVPKGKDVPADLRDVKGNFFRGKGGFRVAGRILPEDFVQGSISSVEPAILAVTPIFALIGGLPLFAYLWLVRKATEKGFKFPMLLAILSSSILWHIGLFLFIGVTAGNAGGKLSLLAKWKAAGQGLEQIPYGPGFFWSLTAIVTLCYVFVRINGTSKARALRLAMQASKLTAESEGELVDMHIEARKAQAENAKRDATPFLKVGDSRAIFFKRGDKFAPSDMDMPVGITVADASTHLFCFGQTGSGKTSSVLRPVGIEYVQSKTGGLIVLDGKGALASEFAQLPGFVNIDPTNPNTIFSLTQDLPAEDVVDAIMSVTGQQDKDDFWKKEGSRLMRNAAILLEHASQLGKPDAGWTLSNIMRTVTDPEYRKWLLTLVSKKHPETDKGGILDTALAYWFDEFVKIPEQTRQSHVGTAMSFLAPVTGHRDLQHWSKAEKGVDITDTLRGAMMGVSTPAFRYGDAGKVVQALALAKVTRAVRRRPADWKVSQDDEYKQHKPLMVLMDEAQEIVGKNEQEMLPVARSLGAIYVAASQNIDGFIARFGESAAESFLNNFCSIVSFASSERTLNYVSSRVGYYERVKRKAKPLGVDFMKEAQILAENPTNDPNHPLRGEYHDTKQGIIATVFQMLPFQDLMAPIGVEFEVVHEPILPLSLANIVLAEPFVAVASLNRAGAPRRDVVKTTPIFDIPQYLQSKGVQA